MDLIRGPIGQRLMIPAIVIQGKISIKSLFSIPVNMVTFNINLLIFNASPKPLYKDIIKNPSPAIHTDGDLLAQ